MKERITVLSAEPVDPKSVHLNSSTLEVDLKAVVRQDRLTFSFSELPKDLQLALSDFHELHLRWSSSQSAPPSPLSLGPFSSDVPPGLHIFYSANREKRLDAFCVILRKAFGRTITCDQSLMDRSAFIPLVDSKRSSFHFYTPLMSLLDAAIFVSESLCSVDRLYCREASSALVSASSFDIDYNPVTQSLIVTTTRIEPEGAQEKLTVHRPKAFESSEIGVLQSENPLEADELSLGGFLAVLGDDTAPRATLFSFPSRHQPLPAAQKAFSYSVAFEHPSGLHPKLLIDFFGDSGAAFSPPRTQCILNAYLTVPSTLFIDRYQFNDPVFLQSNHIRALRYLVGEDDLEQPDYAVSRWGSSIMLGLLTPNTTTRPDRIVPDRPAWRVAIPLHARYLAPQYRQDQGVASMPWPQLFWACIASEEFREESNPFDRSSLGYDHVFESNVMFYHVPPRVIGLSESQPNGLPKRFLSIQVPLLDLNRASILEPCTYTILFLGFAWLLWNLRRASQQSGGAKTR